MATAFQTDRGQEEEWLPVTPGEEVMAAAGMIRDIVGERDPSVPLRPGQQERLALADRLEVIGAGLVADATSLGDQVERLFEEVRRLGAPGIDPRQGPATAPAGFLRAWAEQPEGYRRHFTAAVVQIFTLTLASGRAWMDESEAPRTPATELADVACLLRALVTRALGSPDPLGEEVVEMIDAAGTLTRHAALAATGERHRAEAHARVRALLCTREGLGESYNPAAEPDRLRRAAAVLLWPEPRPNYIQACWPYPFGTFSLRDTTRDLELAEDFLEVWRTATGRATPVLVDDVRGN